MCLHHSFVTALILAVLLPAVFASGDPGVGSTFQLPGLEVANLVAFTLLLLATLIQLAFSFYILTHASTRPLALSAVVTLTILALAYALGIAQIITGFTVDDVGNMLISNIDFVELEEAAAVFYDLADPAIVATVTLILHNRYRAVHTASSSWVFIAFTSTVSLLSILVVTLSIAQVGIGDAAAMAYLNNEISIQEENARFQTAKNTYYAYAAAYIITTPILAVSAMFVLIRNKRDVVMLVTLRAVIPLLLLRAIARLIFIILFAILPTSLSFTDEMFYALDFSQTIVEGMLYFTALGVLLYLLLCRRLWEAKDIPPAQTPGQLGTLQQLHQLEHPQYPQYPQQPQGLQAPQPPQSQQLQQPQLQSQSQQPKQPEDQQSQPQPQPQQPQPPQYSQQPWHSLYSQLPQQPQQSQWFGYLPPSPQSEV